MRGLRQSAWQILVESSEQRLRTGEVDLWDSGKISGEAGAHSIAISHAEWNRQVKFRSAGTAKAGNVPPEGMKRRRLAGRFQVE